MRHAAPLVLIAAATPAFGQYIANGNLDDLAAGPLPNCHAPAGAWKMSPTRCETVPDQVRVIESASFDPWNVGNSLQLRIDSNSFAVLTHNQLSQAIDQLPGQEIQVDFRIWVPASAPHGGYIALGFQGAANASMRGPQLAWMGDGIIAANEYNPSSPDPFFTPIVTNYPRDQWQRVRLHISLAEDRYDVEWAPEGQPLAPVRQDVEFRAGAGIDRIDSFLLAHFGGNQPSTECWIDDVDIHVFGPGVCYPNCDGSTLSPTVNVADFTCFLQRFAAGDPYANCDDSTEAPALNVSDFTCFLFKFAAGCP